MQDPKCELPVQPIKPQVAIYLAKVKSFLCRIGRWRLKVADICDRIRMAVTRPTIGGI